MADHAHANASHDEHEAHGSTGLYLMVFLALCLLTGASFFTYSSYWPFPDQPKIGWAFMMAVSCTKALLVILFFMHLIWEANWKYVLTVPALFMSVFLMLMLVPDIGWRQAHYTRERWIDSSLPASIEAAEDAHLDEQPGPLKLPATHAAEKH